MDLMEKDKLTIKVDEDLVMNRFILHWQGESNEKNPGVFLYPYFEKLIGEALERHFSIEMDISGMLYMNSSTISPIIRLVKEAKNKNIKLVIFYDGSLKWQDLSFSALRVYKSEEGLFDVVDCRGKK